MATRKIKPTHPGRILFEDFLEPLGMSQNTLAKAIGVPVPRVNEIVRGRRSITADTALRLAKFIEGSSAEFWLNLQSRYELRMARQKKDLAKSLRTIKPHKMAATG
ncbi:MAG: HigA family addiction module antitoxin [Thermoanaerobaculia bacterium]